MTPEPETRRAIGYVRVSSVGGRSGPGYHTLQIQRASIERTAAYRRYTLVDVLTDEDESGKTRDRPQFRTAMNRVLAGDADAIIVWKVSRFSRNWREAAEDVETLLDNGKDLLSEEGFDTATAGGRLLLRILFSLANWEHDVLGEHWEVIKTKAVRDRGSFLGPVPIGYRRAEDGGSLIPDEQARDLVVELFERRAAGSTWTQLADLLDEAMPRPNGRRDRKDSRRIVQNRVYLGEVRWRDEINPHAHPPIIPADLWDRANRVATLEQPRQPRRSPTREFPLSGWLHCSGCEGPMGGSVDRSPNGRPAPNYKCSRRRGGCPHPQSISATAAEAWALTQAASLYSRATLAPDSTTSRELTMLLGQLGEIERALHDLASVNMRRELGEDWLPMVRKLRADKLGVEQQVSRARSTNGLPVDSVAWDDLTVREQWGRLRDITPLGALVGPAVRGRSPGLRLAFIVDDTELDAIPK